MYTPTFKHTYMNVNLILLNYSKQYGPEVWKYVQGNIGRRGIVYSATKTSKKRAFKRSFKSEKTKRAVNDKYLYLISGMCSWKTIKFGMGYLKLRMKINNYYKMLFFIMRL